MNTVRNILSVAIDVLYDRCPRNNKYYYCKKSEEYDDSMCTRCMENYLFKIANGEELELENIKLKYRVKELE